MSRFRPRITYANVVSTLCLFLLLGGGAYAAATIGASDIKNDAVRNRHIKDGAVGAKDLNQELLASLKPHCPSGLHRAGDLCFEPEPRSGASWRDALATCARAQMTLPTAGQLALAYDHLGAPQFDEWVAGYYVDNTGPPPSNGGPAYGQTLYDTSSRDLSFHIYPMSSTTPVYRCVTSPMASP